ncbi:tRNA pseudouridine(55) synthase TruB [Halomonas sp. KAO]|uniref:tRNA pseudouridine(55) synthase TruB n=1 Tax=unclassified Halomonas TaxID=2609666 RepID=UPI00189E17F1|nr:MULTISPECIES: tRNA pseudouridine(55) synthase TruB [unclassified Halomonas]MBF7053467.1 tRNA pseudouridine(55) synthase TruB [Halomonas sp. KAO]MDT0502176.1 tRNA pseudouridine(55) synthase TruB [Halomonas sp. PAR7]MDT0513596.1 tRNA pseudouridine(55) synthase TruB [Halomonas sp. LES1]MDT0593069.1 tRNA pseudouridine(55) synthase TruB [Halomonas sp. PAR8]
MARRRRGLPVNGVLLLDKPAGLTSNHALQQARRLFQAQKAGHTGTLDPMATGLLPVCFGEATKFSAHLLASDKVYRTRVELGVVTDTGDAEGEVVERLAIPALTAAEVEAVLARFHGEIEQVPPMYSALKHQGRKLYELAREGKSVERAARRVTVYDARLVSFEGSAFELEVSVSKGTYVRTLAEDIGRELGSGAHISALRRLTTGPFGADGMLTLESLQALPDQSSREATLLPVDVLAAHLPRLEVDAEAARRLTQGQAAAVDAGDIAVGETARLYCNDAFLGLGAVTTPQEVAPKRLLSTAAD